MKFNDVKKVVLSEMGFEVGQRKDGTHGYRSVVGSNMTDETPPENKATADAVMRILSKRKEIEKLSKFDLSQIDIETIAGGAVRVNFEEGSKPLIISAGDIKAEINAGKK